MLFRYQKSFWHGLSQQAVGKSMGCLLGRKRMEVFWSMPEWSPTVRVNQRSQICILTLHLSAFINAYIFISKHLSLSQLNMDFNTCSLYSFNVDFSRIVKKTFDKTLNYSTHKVDITGEVACRVLSWDLCRRMSTVELRLADTAEIGTSTVMRTMCAVPKVPYVY